MWYMKSRYLKLVVVSGLYVVNKIDFLRLEQLYLYPKMALKSTDFGF